MLVLSVDGKGIVLRPEALRPAPAHAAADATTKLSTRLSTGENRNRNRIAEVGTVYDAEPVVRTPADLLARSTDNSTGTNTDAEAPVAVTTWLTASLTDDAATAVGAVFDEAHHRGPRPRADLDRATRRQQPPDRPRSTPKPPAAAVT